MARTKVTLPPFPNYNPEVPHAVTEWLQKVYARLGEGPFMIPGYELANLPPATDWGSRTAGQAFTALIYISDAPAGGGGGLGDGGELAFSDGTVWRYLHNRVPV